MAFQHNWNFHITVNGKVQKQPTTIFSVCSVSDTILSGRVKRRSVVQAHCWEECPFHFSTGKTRNTAYFKISFWQRSIYVPLFHSRLHRCLGAHRPHTNPSKSLMMLQNEPTSLSMCSIFQSYTLPLPFLPLYRSKLLPLIWTGHVEGPGRQSD